MLVPHGSGSSRAVEVSQTVVKALVGIGGVVALLFLVLGGTALSRGVNVTKSRALERENQLLASEIQRLRDLGIYPAAALMEAHQRVAASVLTRHPQIHLLVNNAGIPGRWTIREVSPSRPPGPSGRARRSSPSATASRPRDRTGSRPWPRASTWIS